MTFEEAAASLPNGFPDAELQSFGMDHVQRKLQFGLVVWIGDLDDSRRREIYRPARLTVDDAAFLVIEPPGGNDRFLNAGPIRIDAGQGRPRQSSSSLPDLSAGLPITWIYLGERNAFLLSRLEVCRSFGQVRRRCDDRFRRRHSGGRPCTVGARLSTRAFDLRAQIGHDCAHIGY
jgi:hypothetical protein